MEDMLALRNDARLCAHWFQTDSADSIFFVMHGLEAVYVFLLRKPYLTNKIYCCDMIDSRFLITFKRGRFGRRDGSEH